MRIAITLLTYLHWRGGAERYVDQVAKLLTNAGHEVTIFTGWLRYHAPYPARTDAPARIVSIPLIFGKGNYRFKLQVSKEQLVKRFIDFGTLYLMQDHFFHGKYDLVYGQGPSAMMGLRLRAIQNLAVVTGSYNFNWGNLNQYQSSVLTKSDGLITLNQVTLNRHQTDFKHRLTKQQLVRRIAIDTNRFNPTQRSDALRDIYGIKPNELLLLNLQNMDGRKNLDALLESWMNLADKYEHLKFIVAGGGPNKARYEAWIKEKGYANRIIFSGFIPEETLPVLYASSDIFVAASYGYVSLEAMASGAATILVNHEAQCYEFIEDGKSGLLVDENPEAISTAIEQLVNDETMRKQFSKSGVNFIQEKFAEQRVTQDLLDFFEFVVQNRRSETN